MKIDLASIHVDDQDKALKFYTEVLGFEKMADIPMGDYRWLTVCAPGAPGMQLVLEPGHNPVAKGYMDGLRSMGVPATSFYVDDMDAEVAKLKSRGVNFTSEPTDYGPVILATFEDTCGNLVSLHKPKMMP